MTQAAISNVYPLDKAKPIGFTRSSSGQLYVEGDWPLYTVIAVALCGQQTLESGQTTVSALDANGVVTVTCHTGTAKYQTGQVTSDGVYVCALIKGSRAAFA